MKIKFIVPIHNKKLISAISYSYLDKNNNEIMNRKISSLKANPNKLFPSYAIEDEIKNANNSLEVVQILKRKEVNKIKISFVICKLIHYLIVIDVDVVNEILITIPSYFMKLYYNEQADKNYCRYYESKIKEFFSQKNLKIGVGELKNEKKEYIVANFSIKGTIFSLFKESLQEEKIEYFEHYFIFDKNKE